MPAAPRATVNLICSMLIDIHTADTTEVAIEFDAIRKMMPDYWGPNSVPCFRVVYFDANDRYDKIIYITPDFTVETVPAAENS